MIIFELILCGMTIGGLIFLKTELGKLHESTDEHKDQFNAMIRRDKYIQQHIKDYL